MSEDWMMPCVVDFLLNLLIAYLSDFRHVAWSLMLFFFFNFGGGSCLLDEDNCWFYSLPPDSASHCIGSDLHLNFTYSQTVLEFANIKNKSQLLYNHCRLISLNTQLESNLSFLFRPLLKVTTCSFFSKYVFAIERSKAIAMFKDSLPRRKTFTYELWNVGWLILSVSEGVESPDFSPPNPWQ